MRLKLVYIIKENLKGRYVKIRFQIIHEIRKKAEMYRYFMFINQGDKFERSKQ